MRICPRCGKTYDDGQAFCSVDGSSLSTSSGALESQPGADLRALAPGTTIGSYRVTSILGKGGMGVVYAAEHTRLGRKAALKVLRPELAEDATIVKRFFDEARAANKVGNEHIVEVIDFIEQAGTRAYVMELLEGKPLSKRIGNLTREETLRIGQQCAEALAAVHAAGIVHRDLKPDNIFLTTRGKQSDYVKLLDFGVAKLLEINDANPLTQTGMVLGTPAYMAPEQLKGGEINGRSDIYSFGVILFEMATGQRPFRAKTIPELILKHVADPPPRPTSLVAGFSPMLEELILRCLEKEPKDRPRDMKEIGLKLTEMLERTATDNERTVVAPGQAGMRTRETSNPDDDLASAAASFDADENLFDDDAAAVDAATSLNEPVQVSSDAFQSFHAPSPIKPALKAETSKPIARPVMEVSHATAELTKPEGSVPDDPLATPSPATRSGINLVLDPSASPAATTSEHDSVSLTLPKSRAPLFAAAAVGLVVVVIVAVFIATRSHTDTTKAEDAKPVDVKPVEAKNDEPAKAEEKPIEAKPIEAKPIETKAVVEEKPAVETKPVEATKPVDAKPVDVKPVEKPKIEKAKPKATTPTTTAKPAGKAKSKDKEVPLDPFAN